MRSKANFSVILTRLQTMHSEEPQVNSFSGQGKRNDFWVLEIQTLSFFFGSYFIAPILLDIDIICNGDLSLCVVSRKT